MRGGVLILLFGEDANDTKALTHVVRSLLPDRLAVETRIIRQPPILKHDAAPKKKQAMTHTIAAFARELAPGRSRVVVVAHRDCDAVEPAHVSSSRSLDNELSAAGVAHPVSATPAWEIETWWMAFPEAVRAVKPCWRALTYGARDLGSIADAKEDLTRALRPTDRAAQKRCGDYTESDGVAVAEQIARRALTNDGRVLPRSLSDFRDRLLAALP